jgi:hypothetical protein
MQRNVKKFEFATLVLYEAKFSRPPSEDAVFRAPTLRPLRSLR